jgi:hypothetical protein
VDPVTGDVHIPPGTGLKPYHFHQALPATASVRIEPRKDKTRVVMRDTATSLMAFAPEWASFAERGIGNQGAD